MTPINAALFFILGIGTGVFLTLLTMEIALKFFGGCDAESGD